jgi:hypothetical protein
MSSINVNTTKSVEKTILLENQFVYLKAYVEVPTLC